MDTEYVKKQEILIPLIATADAISGFCDGAKQKNMTLGEYALFALNFTKRAEKELTSSTQKENSESPNLQSKKLHNN